MHTGATISIAIATTSIHGEPGMNEERHCTIAASQWIILSTALNGNIATSRTRATRKGQAACSSMSAQPRADAVRDAQRVGDDRQRRVDGGDRRKEAGIGQVQVVELVRLAVEVEH